MNECPGAEESLTKIQTEQQYQLVLSISQHTKIPTPAVKVKYWQVTKIQRLRNELKPPNLFN